jgi:thiamine-monophosphate kinase
MDENNNIDTTTLADLGEREVIRRLIAEHQPSGYFPLGDDCGAIEIDGRLVLLSTDTKVDDTHFPQGFTGFDKGWTIAAANLSDIAAMGGEPVAFLIAYGLPRETQFSVLQDIQSGIQACLSEYSTPLVGADTKENGVITLTGTVVGIVDKSEVLLRRGSKPGDLVCVSGPLGGASLGLRSMQRGLGIILAEGRLRRPSPRIAEGRMLAKSGACTSCIDISDGLSSSLYELMRASGNGFEIDASSVPMHESLMGMNDENEESLQIALHSGDEYELLFTINPDSVEELRKKFDEEAEHGLYVIGRVTPYKEVILRRDSGNDVLPAGGFEHFR